LLLAWAFYSTRVHSIPAPQYTVVEEGNGFEIREYVVYAIAETRVSASYGEALQEGFSRLAAYIDGNNSTGETIPMTRPIVVDREDAQERNILSDESDVQETYRIAFIMPEYRTLDSLPEPHDVRVMTRIVPSQPIFVKNIACIWNCLSPKKQENIIAKAEEEGVTGKNVLYARYALPWSMPFVVRNELWLLEE